MKRPAAQISIFRRFKNATLIGLLVLAIAALVAPFSVGSSSLSRADEGNISTAVNANHLTPSQGSILSALRSSFGFWALAGETVELFAADCSTPKTAFNLGETVCAKTDGVDVTTNPGNYYMNWIDSSLNQTNGGTITQNPQFFLFVPPTSGTWKATIGSVTPADSSIIGSPPLFTVSANLPGVSTFLSGMSGCTTTPKTSFVLGETVCATAAATGGAAARRRVVWIDPSGNARQVNDITADPQSFSFSIPLTQTTDVGGVEVDNRGKWKVNVVSSRGSLQATTTFVVTDPLNSSADLQVVKAAEEASVSAGSNGTFFITVLNNGPDAAVNVVLTDPLPSNTTFEGLVQSGPAFSCTTPSVGGTGTVTCTLASLPRDGRTNFELEYKVVTGTSVNTTITNTATVASDTDDPDANAPEGSTNSSSSSVTVTPGGGGGGTCTVACPDDIQTPANTFDQDNNPGAIVHFSPPSGTEGCGTITVDHCNDCFFPQGDTVVTATDSTTDESCSFTVTVTAAGSSPTISCPGNKTADTTGADADFCSTNVNAGTATATGQNVTVVGYRSDGLPMYTCDKFGNCTRNSPDARFSVGTTTITWYAYAHDVAGPYTGPVDGNGDPINEADTEEGHRTGSATCTQTVIVYDKTPPTIGATSSTVSANASCQAAIPDYSSTVNDNCACGSADESEACEGHPHITYTQTPAAGTMVGPGSHQVHITANDGSVTPGPDGILGTGDDVQGNVTEKDVTFTVNDTTAPAINCPADISTTTDPGVCSAIVDPGTATATDNCDSTPTITGTRSDSQALNAPYPKGTTTITWRATDDAGNYTECTQTVTVADDEAPVIVFNGQTPSMWPPNHSYHTFTAANFISSVSDNCDSLSVSDVDIISATSDEVENGAGDGDTLNDIVIAANCKSIQLRAERQNNGNGRIYTITFRLRDTSGNITTGTAKVYAPKNEGETPGDNGAHYTVTGTCP